MKALKYCYGNPIQESRYKTPYADLEQFCQNYDHQGEYFSYFVRFKLRIKKNKRFKNIEFQVFIIDQFFWHINCSMYSKERIN